MNWTLIGIELGRFFIFLVCSYVLSMYGVGEILKKSIPDIAKRMLKTDEIQFNQLKAPAARVNKTANAMIAEDLMTNTPLAQVVQMLSEETRAYLKEHPETLPSVMQNYAGTVDLGLKLLPEFRKILNIGATQTKQQFDY